MPGAVARIRQFDEGDRLARPHPTEVDCEFQTVMSAGERYLQLSTFGSDDRSSERKVSQTIQIDRARAMELMRILQKTFPTL